MWVLSKIWKINVSEEKFLYLSFMNIAEKIRDWGGSLRWISWNKPSSSTISASNWNGLENDQEFGEKQTHGFQTAAVTSVTGLLDVVW